MTYITGTLTSANPAADLYTQQIAPALTAAGFTLVDTVVIGTRTHTVWKSAAASNSQNLDWYLDVLYTTTGSGSIWMNCFEMYDPATHLGYRGGYNVSGTFAIETAFFSRYGATGYALETNWYTITAINGGYSNNGFTLSTSAFSYWISITTDRVIGMTSMKTDLVSCGFYVPSADFLARAGSASFPLWVGNALNGAGAVTYGYVNVGALTRYPLIPSGKSAYGTYSPYMGRISESGMLLDDPIGDVTGTNGTGLVTHGPRGAALNIGWSSSSYSTPGAANWDTIRAGTVRDILVFYASSTVTRGDTITINGEQWILGSLVGSYYSLAFRAV